MGAFLCKALGCKGRLRNLYSDNNKQFVNSKNGCAYGKDLLNDKQPLLGATIFLSDSDAEFDESEILKSYTSNQIRRQQEADASNNEQLGKWYSDRHHLINSVLIRNKRLKDACMTAEQEASMLSLCLQNEKLAKQIQKTDSVMKTIVNTGTEIPAVSSETTTTLPSLTQQQPLASIRNESENGIAEGEGVKKLLSNTKRKILLVNDSDVGDDDRVYEANYSFQQSPTNLKMIDNGPVPKNSSELIRVTT